MEHYSQKTNAWSNECMGHSQEKIGPSGCFLTSLGMLSDRDPSITNAILTASDCINSQGMMISECAAKSLGLGYAGKTTSPPNFPCIAETDFYKNKGYPQHFFVYLPNGEIHDPLLSYGPTVNNYPIVSYRLFEKYNEEETMPFNDTEVKNMVKAVIKDFLGYEPSEKDVMGHIGTIKDRQKEPDDYALSEFVHDRFKEMKPKDCTKEVATLREAYYKEVAKLQKSLDETIVALQRAEVTNATLNKELWDAQEEIKKLKLDIKPKEPAKEPTKEVEYCGILNYFMKFFKKGDK